MCVLKLRKINAAKNRQIDLSLKLTLTFLINSFNIRNSNTWKRRRLRVKVNVLKWQCHSIIHWSQKEVGRDATIHHNIATCRPVDDSGRQNWPLTLFDQTGSVRSVSCERKRKTKEEITKKRKREREKEETKTESSVVFFFFKKKEEKKAKKSIFSPRGRFGGFLVLLWFENFFFCEMIYLLLQVFRFWTSTVLVDFNFFIWFVVGKLEEIDRNFF